MAHRAPEQGSRMVIESAAKLPTTMSPWKGRRLACLGVFESFEISRDHEWSERWQ
jgi:hypothetical protein